MNPLHEDFVSHADGKFIPVASLICLAPLSQFDSVTSRRMFPWEFICWLLAHLGLGAFVLVQCGKKKEAADPAPLSAAAESAPRGAAPGVASAEQAAAPAPVVAPASAAVPAPAAPSKSMVAPDPSKLTAGTPPLTERSAVAPTAQPEPAMLKPVEKKEGDKADEKKEPSKMEKSKAHSKKEQSVKKEASKVEDAAGDGYEKVEEMTPEQLAKIAGAPA